jgi:hypothetical protein
MVITISLKMLIKDYSHTFLILKKLATNMALPFNFIPA